MNDWILSTSAADLRAFLRTLGAAGYGPSVRLAIDVYRSRSEAELKIGAMLAAGEIGGPQATRFLRRCARRHAPDPELGDWAIVALARWGVESMANLPLLIELYDGRHTHPLTRASILHALASLAQRAAWGEPMPAALRHRLPDLTISGLDAEEPYARAGAIAVAAALRIRRDALVRIARNDQAEHCGTPIKNLAAEALHNWPP
jgi:hypothetical protein